MSLQHKENGALRLACDGEWCARKFSPQKAFATAEDLRWRATMYGWLTQPAPQKQPPIPGIVAAPLVDLCPECRKATT